MKRLLTVAFACVALAGCVSTTRLADPNAAKPAPGATILAMKPNVNLGVLTASGMIETREDWSKQSQSYLTAAIQKELDGKAHKFKALDKDDAMAGREGQLFRLNEAVSTSMVAFGTLPTKKGAFDWTLGEGAQVLGQTYGGDYALFVSANGSYSSGGRKALFIGMAALGVGIPMGQKQAFASLVELKTGRVLWSNNIIVGPDLREAEGAEATVKLLLKDLPL
jgi:hypothetical protein